MSIKGALKQFFPSMSKQEHLLLQKARDAAAYHAKCLLEIKMLEEQKIIANRKEVKDCLNALIIQLEVLFQIEQIVAFMLFLMFFQT